MLTESSAPHKNARSHLTIRHWLLRRLNLLQKLSPDRTSVIRGASGSPSRTMGSKYRSFTSWSWTLPASISFRDHRRAQSTLLRLIQ